MKRLLLFAVAVVFTMTHAQAQDNIEARAERVMEILSPIFGELYAEPSADEVEPIAVDMQEVERTKRGNFSRFLPSTKRIDRNIHLNKFVYRGEWMLGLAASYGTLSADNSDLLLLLEDINVGFKRTTVHPFVAYAYGDNRAVGMRVGYEMISGSLDNVALNLGSDVDMSFSLGGLALENESLSFSLFHRDYMGLDRRGIVGVIYEMELLVKSGTSIITSGVGEGATASKNNNFTAKLNINPGLAVYVFPEVCVTATVGIGGISYNSIRQVDAAGAELGQRQRSYMRFKVNIADIQIGIVAHIWNKKKN
jgi:hypothetical protein